MAENLRSSAEGAAHMANAADVYYREEWRCGLFPNYIGQSSSMTLLVGSFDP